VRYDWERRDSQMACD